MRFVAVLDLIVDVPAPVRLHQAPTATWYLPLQPAEPKQLFFVTFTVNVTSPASGVSQTEAGCVVVIVLTGEEVVTATSAAGVGVGRVKAQVATPAAPTSNTTRVAMTGRTQPGRCGRSCGPSTVGDLGAG